ncbi:MAG TPA: hypothetical protein VK034_19250 [Enhygromyxa sp.]|nr:hypothetical protein [Enhygromyxa sp.]
MSPAAVQARLDRLRELYVPEDLETARRRLEAERPALRETFNEAAARRLEELRALCELTQVLHAAPKRPSAPK